MKSGTWLGGSGASTLGTTLASLSRVSIQDLDLTGCMCGATGAIGHEAHEVMLEGGEARDLSGADGLALAVLSCPRLRRLAIAGNKLGSRGALLVCRALSHRSPPGAIGAIGGRDAHNLSLSEGGKARNVLLEGGGAQNLSLEGGDAHGVVLSGGEEARNLYGESEEAHDLYGEGKGGVQLLEELDLSDNFLEEGCSEVMDALPSSLTSLSLSANPVGPKGAEALSSVIERGRLPSLSTLNIAAAYIGDPGAIELSISVPLATQLTRLDLSSNGITAEGASALAEAGPEYSPLLLTLLLRRNAVGGDGAAALSAALAASP
ncbi:hypothetical protein T484DRAFT_1908489, partial [Baffinella frigidus]